jgi:hypothetical protein
MTRPTTQAISPFFIVGNVDQTIAFYRDKLGFEAKFQQPDRNPFFAIVGRDGAQIFVKSDKDTSPLPNPERNPSMNRRATTQKSLSMAPSLGLGCWRLKTASCWRRARFLSIRLRRVRNRRSTAPSQSRNRSNMATKL